MTEQTPKPEGVSSPHVAVVMGSDSDYAVMGAAVEVLKQFNVGYFTQVLSAHRTPFDMLHFAESSVERGLKVIIAGAGGAAHLPGMLASMTTIPVIGVPVKLASLDGLDSLLSIVQMPSGVPVATVGIDNAKNAALLALRILSIENSEISHQLELYRISLAEQSRAKTLPV